MVRDRDGRPTRGPPGSALLLCVAGVHCLEIFAVSRSVECDFLSPVSLS